MNRASAWGTHTNRLSGYLYCADCGRRLTLQTHYSKKDGSTQYSYRCGGYASRVNGCTAHSISADNVEALILASVKRFSRFVLKDEETFALELQSLWKEKREEKPKQNQSELKRCQKRYDELSALIRSLYENLMSGLLPERQYKQLMAQYDSEQAELESQMETMKSEIAEDKSSSADREVERGTHYYRQRACAVCGNSYWPTHSQQEFCSDECRRINHNRKTLEFYHKKKGNLKSDPEATPTPKPKEDNAA